MALESAIGAEPLSEACLPICTRLRVPYFREGFAEGNVPLGWGDSKTGAVLWRRWLGAGEGRRSGARFAPNAGVINFGKGSRRGCT